MSFRTAYSIAGCLLVAMTCPPAHAADWVVKSLSGGALIRDANAWRELHPSDVITDGFTLRTLGGAQLAIVSPDVSLSLGGDSTVSVADVAGEISVELHGGAVAAYVQHERRATIVAGATELNLASGDAEVRLTHGGAEVRSRRGLLSVNGKTGGEMTLAPGETVAAGETPPAAEVPAESGDSGAEDSGNGGGNNGQGSENGNANGADKGNGSGREE